MTPKRISAFSKAMQDAGVDAYFASTAVSMGYLHGFHEEGHERFLTLAISATGQVRLICPALSETQAKRTGIEDVRTWVDGEDPLAHLQQLAADWDLTSGILAVDDAMQARQLLQIQATLPAALVKSGGPILSSLMKVKEQEELDLLRKSGQIADDAYLDIIPQLKAGLTEKQIARIIGDALTAHGGTPTFCIVGAGPNGAEPHHLTDDTVVKDGDVLILDFGCDYQGYQSDITRTVGIGNVDPEAHKIYDIVYRAHMAARNAAKAGVSGAEVDAAARKVIEDAGFGPYFMHRTGHGIGTQVHEEPNIVSTNKEPLVAGNCFSVEPGIYLAGRFGVRIENIYAATTTGGQSMNADPSPTLLVLN